MRPCETLRHIGPLGDETLEREVFRDASTDEETLA
jgi:hypothetical protein